MTVPFEKHDLIICLKDVPKCHNVNVFCMHGLSQTVICLLGTVA